MPILYEPKSPRGDFGIWKLTYGQPIKVPFNFVWKGKTSEGILLNLVIDTTCYVVINIKEYLDDKYSIISKTIQMNSNNSILFELTQEDSKLLRMGKKYHMTISLYSSSDELIRILLRDLPLEILGSGVENEQHSEYQ